MDIHEIPTPAIIVDRSRLLHNIKAMSSKAKRNGVALRPHVKTHKCKEIGNLQKKEGAEGITVATISEAQVFMRNGFDDITIAVPLSSGKVDIVIDLNRNATINVLVDNPFILERLSEQSVKSGRKMNVLVKVDCGYHRVGVDPSDDKSVKLVEKIVDLNGLNFKGILTHAGHSYSATSVAEIRSIANHEQSEMIRFASALEDTNTTLKPGTISIGSTPTLMLAESAQPEITEIRPGSYVYFDYTQVRLGVCRLTDCSFSLLTSIISKKTDRLVTDAGATALSKDVGPIHLEPNC
ncbi:MAG: alanine racemase, partial [Candidatus Thorarchaeota archaeon]